MLPVRFSKKRLDSIEERLMKVSSQIQHESYTSLANLIVYSGSFLTLCMIWIAYDNYEASAWTAGVILVTSLAVFSLRRIYYSTQIKKRIWRV